METMTDNLCDSCTNIKCGFQSGVVRTECVFYIPPHIDAVLRQAVIDVIFESRKNFNNEFDQGFFADKIRELPPVNPQQWETCFDCPLSHGCPKIKGCTNEQAIEYASEMPNDCPLSAQPERKTDGDTISRQAAIDCLTATNLKKYDFILDARDKIKNLPPLTPQPKTGHWIDNHNGTISCSNCHTWFYKDDRYAHMRHCPYCNAKISESENV